MFVGNVALEGNLIFVFPVVNTSDVPTAADALPTFAIYSTALGGTPLVTGTSPGLLASETAVYKFSQAINASAGFAAGYQYTILVSYQLSGANRRQTFCFAVI